MIKLLTASWLAGPVADFDTFLLKEKLSCLTWLYFLSIASIEISNGLTALSMLWSIFYTFLAVIISCLRELIDDLSRFEKFKLSLFEHEKPVVACYCAALPLLDEHDE